MNTEKIQAIIKTTIEDKQEDQYDCRDYVDDLIDEVAEMEDEAFNKLAEIEQEKNTDWSY